MSRYTLNRVAESARAARTSDDLQLAMGTLDAAERRAVLAELIRVCRNQLACYLPDAVLPFLNAYRDRDTVDTEPLLDMAANAANRLVESFCLLLYCALEHERSDRYEYAGNAAGWAGRILAGHAPDANPNAWAGDRIAEHCERLAAEQRVAA
jgi:hypothetical protein